MIGRTPRAMARVLVGALAVLLVTLVGALPAWAQDAEPPMVAIVPLDGAPGTSSRDMRVIVRGVAEALEEDGRVRAVYGAELVEQLTAGKAATLQQARDAFAEGTLLLSEGDPDIGLAFLASSLDTHQVAASSVVRREEMADVAFALAEALLAVGDEDGARTALTEALRLLPDYLDTQTESDDPALRALALEAEKDLAARPPRRLSAAGATALADDLQVDRIIHGTVRADGTLALVLFDAEGAVHTESRPGPFRAPRLEDDFYDQLAVPLADAALGLEPRSPEPVADPDPDPDEGPTPPPTDADPMVPAPPSPPEPSRPRKGRTAILAVASVLVVGAAAAGGTVYALERRGPAQDAWDLQIVLVRGRR